MTDELMWFVKVGNRYVIYHQFDMYVRHCFKNHENDVMGWDMLRTHLHNAVMQTADADFEDEDREALDQMVDTLLSCPVCKQVPMYNSRWYCEDCKRQMTVKDVKKALKDLKESTGIQHTLRWEGKKYGVL